MIDPIILPAPSPIVYPVKPVPVPVPPKPKPIKKKPIIEPEAILVSGLAFPRERGEKIRDVFSAYCKRMAVRLNKKYPGIVITVFNFYEGAQQQYEFDGSLLKISIVNSFGKLNVENYRYINWKTDTFETKKPMNDDPLLKAREKDVYYCIGISDYFGSANVNAPDYLDAIMDGKIKEKSISIGNVYSYIEALGRNKPGNLKELHFFSRGDSDQGNPVLVGSYWAEFSPKSKPSKKYVNKDCDEIHDFLKSNGAIKNLIDFEAAFDKDSNIVLWGSFLNRKAQEIINYAMNSKNYKEALSHPKATLIKLDFGTWSLEQVTSFIHDDYLEHSYAHELGVAIFKKDRKKNIYLAPPGSDATTDDEIKQKKFGDPLLHIFMGEDFEDPPHLDFRQILKFYHEAMEVSFLDTGGEYHKIYGRGYIEIY